MLHTIATQQETGQVNEVIMSDMSGNAMEEQITIESRFGPVTIDLDTAVFFPHGLLGLPDNLHFVLTEIPQDGMNNFRLLQCINDHSLSFVVLPIDVDNSLIEKEDLEECCQAAQIAVEDLLVLLIVTVQRVPGNVRITANVRAPVIVDVRDKAAMQYVFPNNKYHIAQQLN